MNRNSVLFAILFVGLALALLPQQVGADYVFSVDKNHVDVYIQSSGIVGIYYELTFSCSPSGDPIDVIDIGLPNRHYILKSAEADLDGTELTRIRRSEYVDPGVEAHLGGKKIRPGSSGTLHFYIECGQVLYQDTEDASFASFRFSPTWFGSRFTRGTTDLRVSFHFPKGVKPDETKWHQRPFDSHSRDEEDRIVFTWVNHSASPSRQYTYGVSFAKKYVEPGAIVKRVTRRKHGRGMLERSVPLLFGLFFAVFATVLVVVASHTQKRRLMRYMPPCLAIEGVGVKRGLTAVEAAVLLEKPLDKVCAMILFGLLRKDVIKVVKARPLRVEVLDRDREGLREYESTFLAAIDKKGRVAETKLRRVITALIKGTNQKMKGFSRRDSRDYYRSIVNKAWEQVASSEAPEVASEVLDRELEWLMIDGEYDRKMRDTLGARRVVVPVWFPGYGTSAPSGIPAISVPSLPGSDFANSVVKSVESFAHGLVSKVESFTANVTRTTNPPATGSWSGSGGSGCACACACAGCACACAGGGR
ncbi:MAG: hypothetical protein ACE5JA_04540 [bacterium]